ncbi:MAG: hypothetical protein ACIRZ2_04240, partial [Ligilactobacillus ruminis]
ASRLRAKRRFLKYARKTRFTVTGKTSILKFARNLVKLSFNFTDKSTFSNEKPISSGYFCHNIRMSCIRKSPG